MSLSRKQSYIERLEEMKARPKKSLGQNFLIDENAIDQIIQAAQKIGNRRFIEIGPGLGALTESLQQDCDQLRLIEMDVEFAEYWKQAGAEVVCGDALKLDWSKLAQDGDWTIVSNLPYQISSSVVIDRCLGPDNILACVFMFQKEVAERIMAEHGGKQFGLLSVMAQTFWSVKKVLNVGYSSFYPAPKVTSRVLSFEKKDPPEYLQQPQQRHEFLKFLKECFKQRRKMLTNNLLNLLGSQGKTREYLEQELESLHLNVKVRPEQLSVEDFQRLFKKLKGI